MSWTARSMTTPTFDMRGGNGPTRVMAIDRMSWSLIACLIDWTAGLKRSTWPTIRVTPARRAAAMMARPSSTVGAIGFSTRMWMPREAQSSAMSRCRWVGAAMVTASTPRSIRPSTSLKAAQPSAPATKSRCLRSGSATPTSLTPCNSAQHARMVAAHDADADHTNAQQHRPRLTLSRLAPCRQPLTPPLQPVIPLARP